MFLQKSSSYNWAADTNLYPLMWGTTRSSSSGATGSPTRSSSTGATGSTTRSRTMVAVVVRSYEGAKLIVEL